MLISLHSSPYLNNNSITSLPSGVFSGLNSLLSLIITHHSMQIQYSSFIYYSIHHIPSLLILSHHSHLMCFQISFFLFPLNSWGPSPTLLLTSILGLCLNITKLINLDYNSLVSLATNTFSSLRNLQSFCLHFHNAVIKTSYTSVTIPLTHFPLTSSPTTLS